MISTELLNIRLHNQLLSIHSLSDPKEIVSWMCAMQSQTLDLAKWAIGVRLGNANVKDIDNALNTGRIIRTHTLRPTWHFVSADDIHWLFDLSKPRLKPIYHSYAKTIKAEELLIYKNFASLEKILMGGKHLTKLEIGVSMKELGIDLDERLLSLLLSFAEVEGVVLCGQVKGYKQTYTLFDEWAPRTISMHKDEALERLARRFFTSHGPATIDDFVWWSGQTLTNCRQAIDSIKHDFIRESINGRDFWMKNDIKSSTVNLDSALLLPPFDEFVVSYKNRSEIISDSFYSKVMTKNGLFSPTIMLNGEIIGSWKKISKQGKPNIELSFFEKMSKKKQDIFNSETKRLIKFYSI